MPEISRLLMTGDTVGGVWTFTMELAGALAGRGIEVVLATMGGEPSETQRTEAAAIPNLMLHASRYKLEWMDDPWQDVEQSAAWLLDLEQHFRPDVIHLNTCGHGALPWRAPVVVTTHSCVVSWWDAVRCTPLPCAWNRYRCEVEYTLKSADIITAPSQFMLHTLQENYGIDLPPRRVIPNGRSAGRFYTAPKEPFILSAGRLWDEAKNVAAVAKIAAGLPWRVYVAGDVNHPNGTLASFPGCRLLGRLSHDELAAWYARAAIYALPACYEPFGLSVLEAAFSGCALVLGDIESLREIWHDAAVFVPPGNPTRLEDALRGLIADRAQREDLARRAGRRARQFTPERMAGEYGEVYEALAAQRRLPCAS